MTLWLAVTVMMGQQPPAVGGPAIREQIACAPMSLPAEPAGALRVTGGYVHGRIMFGPGEPVIVNAGARQGMQKGQMYYVRRRVRDNFTPASIDFVPISIHTAGWVTIVDTKDDLSVAVVTHACDGILDGDYLEPYTDPVVPPPALGGNPDYANPARLVMADERRQSGSEGMLMLINRGSDHGVRGGQRLTIYRDTMNGAGPILDVGRATIVSVTPQTSLIRIDSSREAVYIGDRAAIHRIQ
jgi:hypothetical protein